MYCVTQIKKNKWVGTCVIQDEVLKAEHDTKVKSIAWVIECAKQMNHANITEGEVTIKYGLLNTYDQLTESLEEIKDLKKSQGLNAEQLHEARSKTTDSLLDALDEVNIINLRLRISLKEIARHVHASECPAVEGGSSVCGCAIQLAKDALDNIKG